MQTAQRSKNSHRNQMEFGGLPQGQYGVVVVVALLAKVDKVDDVAVAPDDEVDVDNEIVVVIAEDDTLAADDAVVVSKVVAR